MSLSTFLSIVGPGLGWGAGLAMLLLAALSLLRRVLSERWASAAMTLVMAIGFVAGFVAWFGLPKTWTDEIWKWPVLAAGVAGVLMLVAQASSSRLAWIPLLLVIPAVTWIIVRRFPAADRRYEMAALAGLLVGYLAAAWPVLRDPRPWATGVLVLLISATALAGFVFPPDMNPGQMLLLLAALSGVALVAGIVPITRQMAGAAVGFLAIMFAVVLTIAAFSNSGEYPIATFRWFAAAPAAMAVTWIPSLKRRPWLCAMIAVILAGSILARGVLLALPVFTEFMKSAG